MRWATAAEKQSAALTTMNSGVSIVVQLFFLQMCLYIYLSKSFLIIVFRLISYDVIFLVFKETQHAHTEKSNSGNMNSV